MALFLLLHISSDVVYPMLSPNALLLIYAGPYRAICSAYSRREICLGDRCPDKNCLHGHPGYTVVIAASVIIFSHGYPNHISFVIRI